MSGAEVGLDIPSTDGVSFTVDGKTYHIEPKVFSTKVIRYLVRKYDELFRAKQSEFLTALHQAKTKDEIEVVKQLFGFVASRMEKVSSMIETEDGIAIILSLCCPQLSSEEEAAELVEDYPNFIDLVRMVTQAAGLEALGN